MLRSKTGDVVFYIPGVHYALRDYVRSTNESATFEDNKSITFEDARPIMYHVLVSLKEMHRTLMTLRQHYFGRNEEVARDFWSVFPNFHFHKNKYSIHIDSYRCIQQDIRTPEWIERLNTPPLTEVDVSEEIPEDKRALMYDVLKIFEGFQEAGCPMIEDWGFVTWSWREGTPPAQLKSEPLITSPVL